MALNKRNIQPASKEHRTIADSQDQLTLYAIQSCDVLDQQRCKYSGGIKTVRSLGYQNDLEEYTNLLKENESQIIELLEEN